ncbi:MAG: cytochrome c [Pseudomonadota bacterium]
MEGADAPVANPAAPAGPTRSVWDGVYSSEQAGRGQKGYNSQCARCHGEGLGGGEDSPTLVDQDFLANWNGKSVGDLVEYTRKKMPSDGPGKLSRQLCTDIVAYLLSANRFPVGKANLEPVPDALNQILIEPQK